MDKKSKYIYLKQNTVILELNNVVSRTRCGEGYTHMLPNNRECFIKHEAFDTCYS